MRIVLASASPRRAQILARMVPDFEVIPANVDESMRPGESPETYVERLARAKATAVIATHGDAYVVGADTVVVRDGQVLGKPSDDTAAANMLVSLAGRDHIVVTGVALAGPNIPIRAATERTQVTFRPLNTAEIHRYVTTGSPLDKAGGYGIQDAAGAFVDRIVGSESNVMGLPMSQLVTLARSAGVELFDPARESIDS